MYEAKAAMFIYCVSPVHMGAGTALGAIDSPIQRERHTQHPMMAGSGIKGALRHEATALWDKQLVARLFGPEPREGDSRDGQAGAISFSDAQTVLFPVRSLRRSYVYATCATALARLARLATIAGIKEAAGWNVEKLRNLGRDHCVVLEDGLLTDGKSLILEQYQFTHDPSRTEVLRTVASWLAFAALPQTPEHAYFREKVKADTVLLDDDRFNFFVRNATVVEPHVRISDETGTAEEGGLFYTENLPPESLLVSLVMASNERRRGTNGTLGADQVLHHLKAGPQGIADGGFAGRLVQVGGDATTGRGQVVLSFAP